ncbi:MAG: hypothetical protein U5K99_05495 [Anaerolineales bacterium]|nr:hypothetical protein [Anaerolineales bacterium]
MTAVNLTEFIGLSLGFLLTILIFSYLLGDNPFFQLATHIYIGVSAAYVALVTINNVLIPRLITPIFTGSENEKIISLLLIIPSLFLFTKATPFRKAGNWVVAILIGIGAAAAVGGAITGTLFPQILGGINSFQFSDSTNQPFYIQLINGSVLLLGTISTLIYFHFGTRSKPGQPNRRKKAIDTIGQIGEIFIAITFGALFAGAYLAALAAMIDRLTVLWTYLNNIGIQLLSNL